MVLLVHLLAFCTERQAGTGWECNQTTQAFSSEDHSGNTAEVTDSYVPTEDAYVAGPEKSFVRLDCSAGRYNQKTEKLAALFWKQGCKREVCGRLIGR